jgi:hypothetical protein
MALSADRDYSTSGTTEMIHGVLTPSVTYYKGGLVQFDAATGKVKKPADVAGEYGIGILKRGYVAPASPAMDCEIEIGKIWIPFAGAALTDVGDPVYLTDDGTITKTALTNGGAIGVAMDFKTGYLLVDTRRGGPKTMWA